MTLADYLATKQAREDVRELLNGDNPYLPIMGSDDLCLVRDGVGAWRAVVLWDDDQNKELTAYFRPDGDRYIVTDLGEGFRTACLSGFDRCNQEHMQQLAELAQTFPSDFDTEAPLGTIELRKVAATDLPDAICRVMLASLRVAGVGR